MPQKVTIALDAMGGDHAPVELVKGAISAIKSDPDLTIKLTGRQIDILKTLNDEEFSSDRLIVVDCTEVIETAEHPVKSIRAKKDSSLVRALELVKHGEADAVLSAGNTGALLVGAQTIIGRLKGVERPCLAPIVPTAQGPCCIVDGGANMDAKPTWLVQWAKMGSIYMNLLCDMASPKVGIVNVGAEEEKGNKLVQEAFPLIKELKDINFIGSLESRDVSTGLANVAVCDAFVGNVILKMYEGVAKTLLTEIKQAIMSSTMSKIGGALIKKSLKGVLKKFDASAYGGATLLGTKGLVMKGHGNSEEKQIHLAVELLASLVRKDIVKKIEENIVENTSNIAVDNEE